MQFTTTTFSGYTYYLLAIESFDIVHLKSHISRMVIAVNTKHFLQAYQQKYEMFIYESFLKIANEQPDHTFIIFTETSPDQSHSFPKNLLTITVPVMKTVIVSGILYEIKINALLKKHKAGIFFYADGFSALFTKIPKCFIFNFPGYLSDKAFIKKNRLSLYKQFVPLFVKTAKVIITGSMFSKQHIIKKHKVNEDKIDVMPNEAGNYYTPVTWEQKELVKSEEADGNEYFIFHSDDQGQTKILNLLKGFSRFKKMQKSNMQLLIPINYTLSSDLKETLRLFRYKMDVKLLNDLPVTALAKITAAAYCAIYSLSYESFYSSPLQAMQCNVPVIAADTVFLNETCADTALYINFNDAENIAERLSLIFKDETSRQKLIEKGVQRVKDFSPEKISEVLQQSILKAAG